MPWGAVQLKPGVDTQLSLAANMAGVSQAQLIRYKEGLLQTYGGWQPLVGTTVGSTVRDLHAWQDVTGASHLSAGATNNLVVFTGIMGSEGIVSVQDITPQTLMTDNPPSLSVTAGSDTMTVFDPGGAPSIYNTVYFNTPMAIAGMLISGAYKVISVLSSDLSEYVVQLPSVSSATVSSGGTLPVFAISSGSQNVVVTLPNHNYQAIPGLFQQFIAPTTIGSSDAPPTVVQGKYQIASVLDSTAFSINTPTAASTTASAVMNGGEMEIVYYVTLGPTVHGSGFGAGGFGSGGYGTGVDQPIPRGIPIQAKDWTQDNFGEVLLSCPEDGPVYSWSPDSGFQNAQVVTDAPFRNGGLFVSMPQQILVLWRSSQATGVQDPLLVRWSDAQDYTNFEVTNQTTAGSFHIPTGSRIIGGLQCPVFGMISTDIDVWTMTYVGGDLIFNFNRVGTGCGWISSHACEILAGTPYWMGLNNFFMLGPSGVVPMPCTVWDAVFQNLSWQHHWKTRGAANSPFNEMMWLYAGANSLGEPDSYAKVHIEGQEFEWDYGTVDRTAWIDVTVFGMPIAADHNGQLYHHETSNSITGAGLPTFRTGWWVIAEGQDLPFIDFVIPDFIWGTRAAAQDASILITFFGLDYLGDTPRTYGPYLVTQSTPYINLRFRNRYMSVLVQSNASSEFWRLGRIRFRFASSGRR